MTIDNAEQNIADFYNHGGWKLKDGIAEDTRRFEDLRENAREYVSKCKLRLLKYIPKSGTNMLDMASGPIPYPEYLEYSKNYQKRYCIDLSAKALEDAKKKIGDRGEFLCGSFFDIELEDNFFDCVISLHTLYHIDKDRQEEAVRKLINVAKPGKPIVIVYRNPNTLINQIISPLRAIKKTGKILKNKLFPDRVGAEDELYAFAHPISWWNQFANIAEIKIFPWRSFYSPHQKILIPNNRFGKKIFDILFDLEEKFPNFFIKHFQYPTIVLTKKEIVDLPG